MLHQSKLDRVIDAAAGAMMAREPGRSLGGTVMARVREADAPAPRRFVWMTAAAVLVLTGAIALAVISRAPAPVAPLPRGAELIVGQPLVIPAVPVFIAADAMPARSVAREPRPSSLVATRAPVPQSDVSPIEPIHTEPIVLSSIDVPQLEGETTAIDQLSIEPLTIEPLAASND